MSDIFIAIKKRPDGDDDSYLMDTWEEGYAKICSWITDPIYHHPQVMEKTRGYVKFYNPHDDCEVWLVDEWGSTGEEDWEPMLGSKCFKRFDLS